MGGARGRVGAAVALIVVLGSMVAGLAPSAEGQSTESHVVVAQLDTGVNPFHPCFRDPGANATQAGIPGLPQGIQALELTFESTYEASLEASQEALAGMDPGHQLYHIPGTRLLYWGPPEDLIDTYGHGAMAASQVVCEDYGFAPGAWLLVTNYWDAEDTSRPFEYVAEQGWVDVVHANVQDYPLPFRDNLAQAMSRMVDNGQFVVVAAGNGVAGYLVNYPMELSRFTGPPGSLTVGASGQASTSSPGVRGQPGEQHAGPTFYSNLDPHVMAHGQGTRAADHESFGETSFGGTSSASPRAAGYVAHTILEARERYGDTSGRQGDVLAETPDGTPAPSQGPLSDGRLTVAELHSTVRHTADPNPEAGQGRYSAEPSVYTVPRPGELPTSVYPKEGYGYIGPWTLGHTEGVLSGDLMPRDRPVADRFYNVSETMRQGLWG